MHSSNMDSLLSQWLATLPKLLPNTGTLLFDDNESVDVKKLDAPHRYRYLLLTPLRSFCVIKSINYLQVSGKADINA